MGSQQVEQNEKELLEQQRLEALLEITEQHDKNVAQLRSRLETAEKKYDRLISKSKSDENELKVLRASNPDKLKKQVKRLQEQNRELTDENVALKVKQKQLTGKLESCEKDLKEEKEKNKNNDSSDDEKSGDKQANEKKIKSKKSNAKKAVLKKDESEKTTTKKVNTKKTATKKKTEPKKNSEKKADTKKANVKKSLPKKSESKTSAEKKALSKKTVTRKDNAKK